MDEKVCFKVGDIVKLKKVIDRDLYIESFRDYIFPKPFDSEFKVYATDNSLGHDIIKIMDSKHIGLFGFRSELFDKIGESDDEEIEKINKMKFFASKSYSYGGRK